MVFLFMREMQSNTGLGIPMPLTEHIINTKVDNSVDWSSSSVMMVNYVLKFAWLNMSMEILGRA
jgi:hypothetical protein